jgi:hypothetical protein
MGGTGEAPLAAGEAKAAAKGLDSSERKRNLNDGPFYIGSLKSFSAAQGYGFMYCDELHQQYSRDIYFDRSQLCWVYNVGMLAEFQITLNGRGHPQARNVVWNPIPFAPGDTHAGEQPGPKLPSSAALEKAKKLLRLLNSKEYEGAIVAAIDYQGQGAEKSEASNSIAPERSVDFVSFVLDRVDAVDHGAVQVQDFVKMLLLLMLAKMLRQKFDLPRITKFAKWLERYAADINPKDEAQVVQHFNEVSQQIEKVLTEALAENLHTKEPAISTTIHAVIEQLKQKAQS